MPDEGWGRNPLGPLRGTPVCAAELAAGVAVDAHAFYQRSCAVPQKRFTISQRFGVVEIHMTSS